MESHLHVAIVPRMVPVTAREASQAALDLGQALHDLNAAKVAGGETDIKRAQDAYDAADEVYKTEVKADGVLARVNGAEFPIAGFALESSESGAPMLSLVVAPDSLSIGEPPSIPPPAAPQRVSSWGDGSQPDPREAIPGWVPEKVGGQVADHAERIALRQILSPPTYLRRFGNGGSAAVTA